MTKRSARRDTDSQGWSRRSSSLSTSNIPATYRSTARNSRRREGQGDDFIEEWNRRNLIDGRKDQSKIKLYNDIFLNDGHLRVSTEVGMEPSRGNRKSSVWEHKGHVLWQHQAQRQREASPATEARTRKPSPSRGGYGCLVGQIN